MTHPKIVLTIITAGLYLLLLASGPLTQTGLFTQAVTLGVFGGAVFMTGWLLRRNSAMTANLEANSSPRCEAVVAPAADAANSPATSADTLKDILTELSVMHRSQDLYERYQCFLHVIENGLGACFGPCNVTLWCPDKNRHKLVECRIRREASTGHSLSDGSEPYSRDRQTCEISLDIDIVQEALATQQPAVATDVVRQFQAPTWQPKFDICIPLFRAFGQPVLVMARRITPAGPSFNREVFQECVEIIRHFWQQLQATNQRQWRVEHSELDGVLRDQFFLQRAEALASQWSEKNELFSLCVVSIRGFRQTLGGEAEAWRQMTSLFGRSLDACLIERSEEFLLGRMADDVFVVLLPRQDRFIAQVCFEKVLDSLHPLLAARCEPGRLPRQGLDIQWSLADHTHYDGSIQTLLSEIYKGLFAADETAHVKFQRRLASADCSEVPL